MIECKIGSNVDQKMYAEGSGAELLSDLTIIVTNIVSSIIIEGAKEFNTFNSVSHDEMFKAADRMCDTLFKKCRANIEENIKDSFTENDSHEPSTKESLNAAYSKSSDNEESKKLSNALNDLEKIMQIFAEFLSDEE